MEDLTNSLRTGFIDSQFTSLEHYQPRLVLNSTSNNTKVSEYIRRELNECTSFMFSVAFIAQSGISVLKQTLKDIESTTRGKILTSTYLMFNHPDAFRELLKFKNIDVRIVNDSNFHAKGYLFQKDDVSTMIIGSSNLTQSALNMNNEWNILLSSKNEGKLLMETIQLFNEIWEKSTPLSENWISEYEEEREKLDVKVFEKKNYFENTLRPNAMQIKALEALSQSRERSNRAIVISATGTGKTYLSAFDVKSFNPERFLFIVHRDEILNKAMESFQRVIQSDSFGKYTGEDKETDKQYTFASIQTISKIENLNKFSPTAFDYIVIDEAHHSGASSYLRVIDHFKPKFLLAMTATPERMDQFNIFELFDYNVAYEVRLQEALQEDMLCPFHYFGVAEIEVDGVTLDDNASIHDLASANRVEHILSKSDFYGYSGSSLRSLVFCRSIEEALDLEIKFTERGRKAKSITSNSSPEERKTAIDMLSNNELEFLISVDLLNEGVDIPSVNQIIMLRPTQSSIVFVQQLGRGLRKYDDKEYVVVIDFIGNYKNNFMIPIALFGERSFNRDILKKAVIEGNSIIQGESTICFDRIAKDRILQSISTTSFDGRDFLKKQFKELKNRIGRVPKLCDFIDFDGINPLLFNDSYNSYYHFLQQMKLVPLQSEEINLIFKFISSEVLQGLRLEEVTILQMLLNEDELEQNDERINNESFQSAIRVLSGAHFGDSPQQRSTKIISCQGQQICLIPLLKTALTSEDVKDQFLDCLKFAKRNHELFYHKQYLETNLTLYEKYTRKDVTKLLNWKQFIVPLNIGGYFHDKDSNTLAIFVNYHKKSDIADSIKYEDEFLDSGHLLAISKIGATLKTDTIQNIIHDRTLKKHLFVRKDTEIDGKKFTYLGIVDLYKDPEEGTMSVTNNKGIIEDKSIVKLFYKLETPVRHDLFEYITYEIET